MESPCFRHLLRVVALCLAMTALPGVAHHATASSESKPGVDIERVGEKALAVFGGLTDSNGITPAAFQKGLGIPLQVGDEGGRYFLPAAVRDWALSVQVFPRGKNLKAGFQVALYAQSVLSEYDAPCLFTLDRLKARLSSSGFTLTEDLYAKNHPPGWDFRKNDLLIRVEETDLIGPQGCVRMVSTVDGEVTA